MFSIMGGMHIISVCSSPCSVHSTDASHELSFLDFFVSHRLTHNWWHVAVCYLEAESPLCKVLEIYDHNIMKELEKSDCEAAEVLFIGGYFTLDIDCLGY